MFSRFTHHVINRCKLAPLVITSVLLETEGGGYLIEYPDLPVGIRSVTAHGVYLLPLVSIYLRGAHNYCLNQDLRIYRIETGTANVIGGWGHLAPAGRYVYSRGIESSCQAPAGRQVPLGWIAD